MQEHFVSVVEHQRFGGWSRWTLAAPALAAIDPGQYVALRCAPPGSYDPLVRVPLWLADADTRRGTVALLLAHTDPAWQWLAQQPVGGSVNLLGPLGRGWQIAPTARTLALVGTAAHAGALFGAAQHAVRRGLAVSLLLGADEPTAAPPPFLLPADAEYNIAGARDEGHGARGRGGEGEKETRGQGAGETRSGGDTGTKKRKKGQQTTAATDPIPAQLTETHRAAAAALQQLSDDTLRWADVLLCALPLDLLPSLAQRVRSTRLNWTDNLAQALLLPPPVCHVGVCGVCSVPTRHGYRLACVDGPVFDLKDLFR